MLKIGEFSKLSRISVRMLRHYDEIGLLNPAQTDRFTDYRYYREDQLPVASRITALKEMGFRLAEVRELLALWDDREALERSLSAQRLRLREEAAEAARRLRLLDTAMERLRKEASMNYNVVIRTLPERYAACVRMKLPRYEDEGLVWKLLCEETDAMRLVPAAPCLCSVVFLDEEYQESDVEVEAQKTVQAITRIRRMSASAPCLQSPMPAAPSRAAMTRSTMWWPPSPHGSGITAIRPAAPCSISIMSAPTRRRTLRSSSRRSASPCGSSKDQHPGPGAAACAPGLCPDAAGRRFFVFTNRKNASILRKHSSERRYALCRCSPPRSFPPILPICSGMWKPFCRPEPIGSMWM